MKCSICGIAIDSIGEAIDTGWIPYFYEGEKEHEFACPGCAESLLQLGEDREMEVKEEYRGKIAYQDDTPKEHLLLGVVLEYSEN